eukprot:1161835-Pelagomonas_calceolata.AAC.9
MVPRALCDATCLCDVMPCAVCGATGRSGGPVCGGLHPGRPSAEGSAALRSGACAGSGGLH